jgi:hypothetical protein
MLVCHHCDNPPCVNPDHLFLGTAADNSADMKAKGRASDGSNVPRGVHHYGARLDPDKVREIRALMSEGASRMRVARSFGVTPGAIQSIVDRHSWKHVQ